MLFENSLCFTYLSIQPSILSRGLTEKQVHSASDVLNLMKKAQHSRMVGETKMNKGSSRSHCLFTIQVHGKVSLLDGEGDMEFNGKLHMVDLAGSEVRWFIPIAS